MIQWIICRPGCGFAAQGEKFRDGFDRYNPVRCASYNASYSRSVEKRLRNKISARLGKACNPARR